MAAHLLSAYIHQHGVDTAPFDHDSFFERPIESEIIVHQ
jgi:hypothetical protein